MNFNRASLLLSIIAIVVSVGGIYVGAQTDWTIATQSRVLERPDIVVGLASLPLEPTRETRVIVGATEISTGNQVVIASLPFSIENTGTRTADNTTITFRFHELFGRDPLEQLAFNPVGTIQATQLTRLFTKSGSLQYSSYLLPEIHPGDVVSLNEPLYLPSTSHMVQVEAATTDNLQVSFDARVELELQFVVSLAARDLIGLDYQISLETAEAESMEDLSQRVALRRVSGRMEEARQKVTFGEYLRALLFGAEDERLYLIFVELDEHKIAEGEGSLWFGRANPRVRELSYRPVSWSLLFNPQRG